MSTKKIRPRLWQLVLPAVPLLLSSQGTLGQAEPPEACTDSSEILDIDFRVEADWGAADGQKSYRREGRNVVVAASPRLGWDAITGLGANRNAEIDSPSEDLTVSGFWGPEVLSGVCISNLSVGDSGTINVTYVATDAGSIDPSVTVEKEFPFTYDGTSGAGELFITFDDGLLVTQAVFEISDPRSGFSVAGFRLSETVVIECKDGNQGCKTDTEDVINTGELKGTIARLEQDSGFEAKIKLNEVLTFEDPRPECHCDPKVTLCTQPPPPLMLDFEDGLATTTVASPPGINQIIISGDYCGTRLADSDDFILRAADIDSSFVQYFGERIETVIQNVLEQQANDCRVLPDDVEALWLPKAFDDGVPEPEREVPVLDADGVPLAEMISVSDGCGSRRTSSRYSWLVWNARLAPHLAKADWKQKVLDTVELASAVNDQTGICTTNGNATSRVSSLLNKAAFQIEKDDYPRAISTMNDFLVDIDSPGTIEAMRSCFWNFASSPQSGANPYLEDNPDGDTAEDGKVPAGYNALLYSLGRNIEYQVCGRLAERDYPEDYCAATWGGPGDDELNATCAAMLPSECNE